MNLQAEKRGKTEPEIVELEEITVRLSGDSGDGMQLVGTQMTNTSAIFGNDVSTFPDFPAEIRAPGGSVAGVSGFQLNFGAHRLRTPGDRVDGHVGNRAEPWRIPDVDSLPVFDIAHSRWIPASVDHSWVPRRELDEYSGPRFRAGRGVLAGAGLPATCGPMCRPWTAKRNPPKGGRGGPVIVPGADNRR